MIPMMRRRCEVSTVYVCQSCGKEHSHWYDHICCLHRKVEKLLTPNSQPKPDRSEEYRAIWLERAQIRFDGTYAPDVSYETAAGWAFDAADAFIAELKRRDGNA